MYFLIKVIHAKMVESTKKGAPPVKRTVSSTYCVADEVLEGAIDKANKHFAETLQEHRIKSVSDCVISEYVGDTKKARMYQVRVHWKMPTDKGAIKIHTEYILVDGNSITEVEVTVTKKYKDVMMDYEIYSINGAKVTEVLES